MTSLIITDCDAIFDGIVGVIPVFLLIKAQTTLFFHFLVNFSYLTVGIYTLPIF